MRIAFVQDVNTFSVPIGTAIIAGVLRDKGHEVDLFVDENKIDKTIYDLNKYKPDIIGMIVTSGSHVKYIEISKAYSTPKSKEFINGILDTFIKDILLKN